jgi:response regulator RpfG family c-di-GMP phosphodiesterase
MVDDDPGTLDCLREAFEHHGCLVSAAATAGHALARLTAEPVHLVVSDIRMPGLSGLDLEATVVRHHLERYDGTGSPDRLEGDRIPMAARILAVADAFDAMTSSRPYRAALALEDARAEMLGDAGTQFDPLVGRGVRRSPRGPSRRDHPVLPDRRALKSHAVPPPLRSARAHRGRSPSRHGR